MQSRVVCVTRTKYNHEWCEFGLDEIQSQAVYVYKEYIEINCRFSLSLSSLSFPFFVETIEYTYNLRTFQRADAKYKKIKLSSNW